MTEQLTKAKAFIEEHFSTVHGLKKDPITHAVEVVRVLKEEFKQEADDLLVAGMLHDVLEDCFNVSFELLSTEFSPHIAELVRDVSHDRGGNFDREAFYERLKTIPTESKWLKLADLYTNLERMLLGIDEGKPVFQSHAPFLRHVRIFLAACTDPMLANAVIKTEQLCKSIQRSEKDSSALETLLVNADA